MPFARHPLSRSLLAIALLAALAACKQSAPLATSDNQEKPAPAAAPSEEAIAVAAAANAAADSASAASPLAPMAPTPIEVKPVIADKAAKDEVIAAMDKFKGLRRYRITMLRGDGQATPTTTTVDYVAPDRYRMAATGLPEQVVIGDTFYTTDASGTRKSTVPVDSIAQWRDPNGFLAAGQDFTAEKGPRRFVFAMPASEYKLHVTKPAASNMSLWIGPKGLPIKLQSEGLVGGKLITTMIRYSHFDSEDIKIDAPK
jgi:predicted small lipoprotein YifL